MSEFWKSDTAKVLVRTVTPDLAREMLTGSETVQRQLRSSWVKELARRMAAGLWSSPTDQEPLMFDVNGRCIEGQHRLSAVIEASVALAMQMKIGCSTDAIRTIGEGKTRNPSDKISVRMGQKISALSVAIATRMLDPQGATAATTVEQREEFFIRHRETIVAVESINTGKRGRRLPSPVLSVIGRAWYSRPHNRLREFVAILITGEYDRAVPGHLGAFKFREWLDDNTANGTEARIDMYWQTVAALDAFLRGHDRTMIKPCNEERFLLPDEKTPAVYVKAKKRAERSKREAA